MLFKIETKEKFKVISIISPELSAALTDELSRTIQSVLEEEPKNIVLNLSELTVIDPPAMHWLVQMHQNFYENKASFVICGLSKPLQKQLDEAELLEMLNHTPTESEAYDIVQMEEIERELMGDDEE
ncbi:MAG TPA: STAS domain-containing protein [Parasegetibacter sp.]|jgi:anti-anti-sigma factor